MSLEGSELILLTRISMLMFMTSVSVLVIVSRGSVMMFPAGFFFGVLTFIFSILMVECISKVPVNNRVNH